MTSLESLGSTNRPLTTIGAASKGATDATANAALTVDVNGSLYAVSGDRKLVAVQQDTVRSALPALRAGRSFRDTVVPPSQARGVYPIGPTFTLRGDPFGLVRRQIRWTEPVEFVVHPRTVFLNPVDAGLLRDVDDRSTSDMSAHDLAFHALRPYVAGNDQRHIHCLSTAKRSAASGRDEFMVRQFLDTRSSHRGIVLDLFSRAGLGEESIGSRCARLAPASSGVNSVVLVTGPLPLLVQLSQARAAFGPDVRVIAIRVEHGAEMAPQRSSGLLVVAIGKLEDLSIALARQTAS